MKYARFVSVALTAFFFLCAGAHAQWQVPQHSVPVGLGSANIGFGNAGPGAADLPLIGNGASADPSFRLLPSTGLAAGAANSVKGSLNGTAATDIPVPSCSSALTYGAGSGFTCNTTTFCQTLEAYGGGVGATGVANVAAFASAFAALPIGGGCIALGNGTYALSSAVTLNLPNTTFNLTIAGTGQNSTQLNWTAAGGLTINYNSPSNAINIRDVSLITTIAGAGTAINLNQSAGGGGPVFSNFDRVAVGGTSGYWNHSFMSGGVNAINITGSSFYGTTSTDGVWCQGLSGTQYTVIMNIDKSNFWNQPFAVVMGSYCQSLFISGSNFVAGGTGIIALGSLGVLSNLNIDRNEISLGSGAAISVSTNVIDVQVVDNFIGVAAGQTAFQQSSGGFGNVFGNDVSCTPTNGNGVSLSGTVTGFSVTGNAFRSCSTGVLLGASTSNNNVQSNMYSGSGTHVTNSAGAANTVGGGSP